MAFFNDISPVVNQLVPGCTNKLVSRDKKRNSPDLIFCYLKIITACGFFTAILATSTVACKHRISGSDKNKSRLLLL